MPAIEVRGLSKHYGDVRAVSDLTFAVEAGEIFGFLGPNGAGKTTLIRTLMGFQSPTAGVGTVLGTDVTDSRGLRETMRRVGFLPSEPGLDETATGGRLLDYYGSLRGEDRREELLDLFSPPLDRRVGDYSRGNKQMLAITLAFMHDPDLVIMDEPTSGLDPLKQELFLDFLRRERARGKTLFLSSHVLTEVRKVCDRVAIIRAGRLVELDAVDRLLTRAGKLVRVRVADPVSAAEFALDGAHDVTLGAGRSVEAGDDEAGGETDAGADPDATSVSFTFTGEYNALVRHLTEFDVLDIEVEEAPIEEVFMRFYGDSPADGTEAATSETEAAAAGTDADSEVP